MHEVDRENFNVARSKYNKICLTIIVSVLMLCMTSCYLSEMHYKHNHPDVYKEFINKQEQDK